MIVLEFILEVLFAGLVQGTGVLVRWSFVAAMQLATGAEVITFRKFFVKMTRDKDPSNQMSDSMIHWLLGIGAWIGVVLLLV